MNLLFAISSLLSISSASYYGSYPITTAPSDDALCDCFDFDLLHEPEPEGDNVCYTYKLKRTSPSSSCLDAFDELDSVILLISTTDAHKCNLGEDDMDDLVADYAPRCYDMNGEYHPADSVYGLEVEFAPRGIART